MNKVVALGGGTLIIGDALSALKNISDCSVNTCITSPPYYGLRDYGVDGQLGLEESPEKYIDRLVEVFREVKRVLRDDGTLWLNIADCYAGSGKGAAQYPDNAAKYKQGTNKGMVGASKTTTVKTPGIKHKDLIGIPWMLAFALRADGWYLRQDIIWNKPNCMPESVRDRCTKAHEYIFLLSKSSKYYFDHEAIKEPCVGFDKSSPRGSKGTLTPNAGRRKGNAKSFRGGGAYTSGRSFNNNAVIDRDTHGNAPNDTGLRNRRDVWTVATHGCKGNHFATFPAALIEPCVLAGSPHGGVVLDPFLGSGTVGMVSRDNGRSWIGIELNPEYESLIIERTKVKARV